MAGQSRDLLHLLEPPVVTNRDDAERAYTLHTILLVGIAVLVALLTLSVALRPDQFRSHVLYAGMLVLHLGEFALLRSGRVGLAVRSHCILYVAGVTAAMWSMGGLRTPAGYLLPPAVLMSGLVWSGRAALWFAAISSAIGFGLVILQEQGFLPHLTPPTALMRLWGVLTGTLVVTAAMLHTALRSMRRYHVDALRHAQRHDDLVKGAPDAMIFADGKLRVQALNPAAVRLFDVAEESAVGRELLDLDAFDATARERIRGAVLELEHEHEVRPIEVKLRAHDQEIPVEIRVRRSSDGGHAFGIHLTFRDLSELRALETERASLERQLEQSRRLEAIGRLSAGVAHDFNNLLTVIVGQTGLAKRREPSVAESLEVVEQAAGRATELTRQLLAFGRRQVLRPEVVRLEGVLDEMRPLLERLCAADVRLQLRHGTTRPIAVDRVQLEQVLVNLVSNARDAVSGHGSIAIETGSEGDEVWIRVSDDGEGIDEAHVAHVFEPFFTTKGPGAGTGLGLATVHGIVTQSGGRIELESKKGAGSTFTVTFPAVDGRPSERPAPVRAERSAPPQALSVLVVDDEPLVRRVVRAILESAGYRIVGCESSREALRVAEKVANLDLVITDVVMPELSGPELFARIAERHPQARVLYCSGYAEDLVEKRGVSAGNAEFLHKPFDRATLLAKVQELLSRMPPA